MRKLSVLLIVLILAGCASAPTPVAMTTPFDPVEHSSYKNPGTGSIKGQGFMRQQGGTVVTCAGSTAYLFPDTGYFREIIQIAKSRQTVAAAIPIEAQQTVRTSDCDAQGNFSYSNIPAGKWFITVEVKWIIGYYPQGGSLLRNILVTDGQSQEILLSDKDFIAR